MFRLKLTISSICLGLSLASCQSVPIQKAVETKPAIIKVEQKPKLLKDDGLAVINIAIEQVKNSHFDVAKNILKGYLENHDDNRAKLNLALIYLNNEQPLKAKKLLISVRNSDSSNSTALEHLAIIARQDGQFKEAKALYLEALDHSDKASIHLNLAIVLDLYLNELTDALSHYKAYQKSDLAEQDGIQLEKWIADLNVRIKRIK